MFFFFFYLLVIHVPHENQKKLKKSKSLVYKKPCSTCGIFGHVRTTSKYCRMNPKNPDYDGTFSLNFFEKTVGFSLYFFATKQHSSCNVQHKLHTIE